MFWKNMLPLSSCILKISLIYLIAGMPTSAVLSTMSNSFSSPARTVGSLQQSSPFLSTQPPKEDRYAALKDLDSLMKTQQASSEPQFSDWPTGVVYVLKITVLVLVRGLNCAHICHICYILHALYSVIILMFGPRDFLLGRSVLLEKP
jgi:hypothetical protein